MRGSIIPLSALLWYQIGLSITAIMVQLTPGQEIFYPSSDGELAETYIHLYAILKTLEVLKQYLGDHRATVLANQFLDYRSAVRRIKAKNE